MIALPLQTTIFALMVGAIGVAVLVGTVMLYQRSRDPLLASSGLNVNQLGELFNTAPFGLLVLDQQLRLVYANAYTYGLLPIEQSGAPFNYATWLSDLQRDLVELHKQNKDHAFYRMLTLPSGKTISWWICSLPRFNLLFLTDLSHQRHLQKASQTFLGTLSHELRTPLTAVLAHLDIVRNQELDERSREHSLTIIHQEVSRLTRLVQDLIYLGRSEMSEVVTDVKFDLLLVAEAAIAEVILPAEAKGITMSLEASAGLPFVIGDADRMKQVFLNLLDNSIQYSHPGDEVTVRMDSTKDGIQVAVVDTGTSIPPEHLPHVVERFYRIGKDNEGTGLGLAIVVELLRLHDTQLKLESPINDSGKGVRASFLVPSHRCELHNPI